MGASCMPSISTHVACVPTPAYDVVHSFLLRVCLCSVSLSLIYVCKYGWHHKSYNTCFDTCFKILTSVRGKIEPGCKVPLRVGNNVILAGDCEFTVKEIFVL